MVELENSLTFFNLLGIGPVATKICVVLIVTLPLACISLRLWYPCVTPHSLLRTVSYAKEMFDKCVATDAFGDGEFDRYRRRLYQITARAYEISTRRPDSPTRRRYHHWYPTDPVFIWNRLKDIVGCYRVARTLVYELNVSHYGSPAVVKLVLKGLAEGVLVTGFSRSSPIQRAKRAKVTEFK